MEYGGQNEYFEIKKIIFLQKNGRKDW